MIDMEQLTPDNLRTYLKSHPRQRFVCGSAQRCAVAQFIADTMLEPNQAVHVNLGGMYVYSGVKLAKSGHDELIIDMKTGKFVPDSDAMHYHFDKPWVEEFIMAFDDIDTYGTGSQSARVLDRVLADLGEETADAEVTN